MESELIEFGLNPSQAKVYLTILRLGEATASAIATHSGFQRLTTYSILEKLREVGLIGFYEKRRVRVYKAHSPEALLSYCDDQILLIQAKRLRMQALLPQLHECSASAGESPISFLHSIRSIKDPILFQNKAIRALSEEGDWYVIHDGSFWESLSVIQSKVSMVPRCLLPYSQKRFVSGYSHPLKVTHFPDGQLKGPLNVLIMRNCVFFLVTDGDLFEVIEIKDHSVASHLRSFFWLLWGCDFPKD